MTTATKPLPTFVVDKAGMAKVFARKGKAFIVTELLQNAWDEDTKHVDVILEPLPNGKVRITVEDDNPDGFADLKHAYTLFAESAKKADPRKRGRFNLGEKLVIAVCDEASIVTTKGTVHFGKSGRTMSTKKRKAGSCFTGVLSMSKAEQAEVASVVGTLIPPLGVTTTFNLADVPMREAVASFEATLRTERSDEEGRLKPTARKTEVTLFDPLPGEVATLYEMGIPVVETGDRFHVNVGQKVPLNMDRDNVTPAYLRDLRTLVLNESFGLMTGPELQVGWVTEALTDGNVSPEAVAAALKGRYGEKFVIADPTDPEANKIAMEKGYTVIPGGALPKAAWKNVKATKQALPAGQVTPSPRPPTEGESASILERDHWPTALAEVAEFSRLLAASLLAVDVNVVMLNETKYPFAATWQRQSDEKAELVFNVGRLGFKWFSGPRHRIIDLVLHEMGHQEGGGDHLDRRYLNELTRLGAEAVELALREPDIFEFRAAKVALKDLREATS